MNAPEALPGDATLTVEQKEYLQGFSAGLAAASALPFVGQNAQGLLTASPGDGSPNLAAPSKWFGFDLDEITNEERLKREQNPLDIWDKMLANASANKAPEGGDVYRFKFHGLFYVAPAQDAFMVRVRMPGNVLTSTQMRGLAAIARDLGGGYGHVTTRGNIQIREIAPKSTIDVLMRLSDVGLSTRGAGADNVRNLTSSPLAGIDPDELIDTRPLARGLQSYLANNRDLFGLPRKFNISFDGGGRVSVVADTNDIGFVATQVDAIAWHRARGVFPRLAGGHHRSPALRGRLRHSGQRRAMRCRCGGHAARLRRARRSHRPQESAAVLCARSHRCRQISRLDPGEASFSTAPRGR